MTSPFTDKCESPINGADDLRNAYKQLLLYLKGRGHNTIEESISFLMTCMIQMEASRIFYKTSTYDDVCKQMRAQLESCLIGLKYLIKPESELTSDNFEQFQSELKKIDSMVDLI